MERALHWLSRPPVVDDDESQRVARLLHVILLTAGAVCIAAAAIHVFLLGAVGATIFVYPPVLATIVVLLAVLARGHVWGVAIALQMMFWAAIVASAVTDGGLYGPTLGGLVMIMIVATLLFGRRLVLAFAVLCFLTLVAFYALDVTGMMPARMTPDTPELAFLVRAIHLGGSGMFLYLAVRNLQDARRAAREGQVQGAELLREATTARRYADNVLASMAESLVVVDARGQIETVNKAAVELLGHAPGDLVGRHYTTILPDYGAHISDHTPQHESVERVYRHRDGHDVPVLLTRSPLRDEEGDPIGSVCVASDISRLKDAENSLREAKQIAEEASQAKSRFLANMSHELRTPLNAVIGYAEMLLEEADERGLRGSIDELRKVQFAGKHLLGLIADILDLSKIEAGRMDIHMETFDVADMIETVLGTVRPLMGRNSNQLVVHCPSSIGFIHADLTKIRQILLNLLSNAAKFTDHGTVKLNVTRSLGTSGRIVFAIADSGIGMTQGQLAQLFQAFSQADASTARRYGGTGLGLAISKAFVDMLGGSIEVQSKLGGGSLFTVKLPFVDPLELSMSKRPPGLTQALARARENRDRG
jgi:PAS domain S-box-containing protein